MNKRKLSEAGGRTLQAEGTAYANWRQVIQCGRRVEFERRMAKSK